MRRNIPLQKYITLSRRRLWHTVAFTITIIVWSGGPLTPRKYKPIFFVQCKICRSLPCPAGTRVFDGTSSAESQLQSFRVELFVIQTVLCSFRVWRVFRDVLPLPVICLFPLLLLFVFFLESSVYLISSVLYRFCDPCRPSVKAYHPMYPL